ncbi:MAG: thermonuclease family protein [Planctomycetes bacterium]|nr:thermonuclease family protein [Planctomycetota bacterium]
MAGLVVGIADGDTLTVLDAEKNQHKIRLHGIDTPESSQAFGTRAKQALSEKVFQKNIRVDHATVCTSSKTHVLLERNESSSSVSRLDE